MIYIGFSTKTNKLLANILCKTYCHCAPVFITHDKCVLYQFVRYKKIVPIYIRPTDINILKNFGWIFIKYNKHIVTNKILKQNAFTCVQFTKRVLQIHNLAVQTPDALLQYLTHQ